MTTLLLRRDEADRLLAGDRIVAIDGRPLDREVEHSEVVPAAPAVTETPTQARSAAQGRVEPGAGDTEPIADSPSVAERRALSQRA